MKNKIFNKLLLLLVILALLAAMALTFTACTDGAQKEATDTTAQTTAAVESEGTSKLILGNGATQIKAKVVYQNGTEKTFTVNTDKTNVGDAFVEVGLISGEEGQFGWFITTVDGEYHKWEDDGKYWAFYIDGEYAMTGVSSTEVVAGTKYEFRVE